MKKVALAVASLALLAVPVTFAMEGIGFGPSGSEMSQKKGSHMMGKSHDFTKLPQSVQDALKTQGITLPTADEVQAFQTKMKNNMNAVKNLSDADKASLKTLREEFQAKEREFLRSKGVDLPTEDQIAQMKKVREAITTELGKLPHSEVKKMRKDTRKEMRNKMKEGKGNLR